jgi:hypothetical protein
MAWQDSSTSFSAHPGRLGGIGNDAAPMAHTEIWYGLCFVSIWGNHPLSKDLSRRMSFKAFLESTTWRGEGQ